MTDPMRDSRIPSRTSQDGNLRDALTAALNQARFNYDEADAVLADPAFRAALTASIAEGFMWHMDVDPCEHCTWSTDDSANNIAAAIVAEMLRADR